MFSKISLSHALVIELSAAELSPFWLIVFSDVMFLTYSRALLCRMCKGDYAKESKHRIHEIPDIWTLSSVNSGV